MACSDRWKIVESWMYQLYMQETMIYTCRTRSKAKSLRLT